MKRCPSCQTAFPADYTHCPLDGNSLVAMGEWADGTLVRGKYRILAKVGQGGMGSVYKAMHTRFKEVRALKVMGMELSGDPNFFRRFEQEAIITRKLQHPNAVRVEDIDETEDGRPFIVMEYIEGLSLKDVIEREAPMAVARVCSIIKQAAAALDAAHALGLIHRDIKPGNLALISSKEASSLRSEQVKVLDFGIAKLREAHLEDSRAQYLSHLTLTHTGAVVGTPAYMSPEQAKGMRGDELDGRSDLYSLGIVMYQMLTSELPLKADSTIEQLMAHLNTPPKPIREVRPDVPEAIAAIVMRCLEKKRELRPANGRALIAEIDAATEAASPAVVTRMDSGTEPARAEVVTRIDSKAEPTSRPAATKVDAVAEPAPVAATTKIVSRPQPAPSPTGTKDEAKTQATPASTPPSPIPTTPSFLAARSATIPTAPVAPVATSQAVRPWLWVALAVAIAGAIGARWYLQKVHGPAVAENRVAPPAPITTSMPSGADAGTLTPEKPSATKAGSTAAARAAAPSGKAAIKEPPASKVIAQAKAAALTSPVATAANSPGQVAAAANTGPPPSTAAVANSSPPTPSNAPTQPKSNSQPASAQPTTPATPSAATTGISVAGGTVFDVFHYHSWPTGSDAHLTVSAGGLQYEEYGDEANPADDFKVTCSEVREAKASGGHFSRHVPHSFQIKLPFKTVNNLVPSSPQDRAVKVNEIVDAISKACSLH